MIKNFGLLQDKISPNDWIAGGFTPLAGDILQPNGNWQEYLPVVEYQNGGGFDRMACVTYSFLNCLEILYLRHKGREINFSDRALAKMSGTSKKGNFLYRVAETARKEGLLLENDYKDVDTNWTDYYKDIPNDLIEKALDIKKEFDIYHEWVPMDRSIIKESLKESPLQVTVKYASGNGTLNPEGQWQHAVTLYGADDHYQIFDHYTQTRKVYHRDYRFGAILKPTIIFKNTNMLKLKENHLYLLVEGKEQKLAVAIDGKLTIYDKKIDTLLNSASRANKYLPPIPVTLADWNNCIRVSGKGETIK